MEKIYTSPNVIVIRIESPTIISDSGHSYKLKKNEIREDASGARAKLYDDKSLWDDLDDE